MEQNKNMLSNSSVVTYLDCCTVLFCCFFHLSSRSTYTSVGLFHCRTFFFYYSFYHFINIFLWGKKYKWSCTVHCFFIVFVLFLCNMLFASGSQKSVFRLYLKALYMGVFYSRTEIRIMKI